MDPYDPPLDTVRHLRYWKRCVSTLLPHHYTSMDSTRLSLGFFIMASIDLLTPPPPPTNANTTDTTTTKPLLTPTDRLRLRRWVLSCQHPRGGFCGSPTHVLPREHQQSDVENAHIGGTYFALLLLALLADDDVDGDEGRSADAAFAGVDRARTLRWLRRLQRPEDGSFGEAVYDPPSTTTTTTTTTNTATGEITQTGDVESGSNGDSATSPQPMIAGGRDMRYSYLAAAVRWMLRGDTSDSSTSGADDPNYVEDIDVPALVAHIRRAQTYDGGFAETWAHESHAGYGYCAVAALSLLDRPPEGSGAGVGAAAGGSRAVRDGVPDVPALVSWLASRQFEYVQGGEDADDEDDDDPNFRFAALSLSDGPTGGAQDPPPPAQHIGFNGRCNKVADTCYTWWNLGTLAVLDIIPPSCAPETGNETETDDPANLRARRAFLLDKTQHLIGGFGKHPGSPPDVGHACLGLAALATMGDPSLRRLDPALCVSVEAVRKVERARRGLLRRQAAADGEGEAEGVGGAGLARSGRRLVDMAIRMGGGERPEWLDAVA